MSNIEAIGDPTYLNAGVVYWTTAETSVAHLCAAAPAIRPLYVKLRNTFRRKEDVGNKDVGKDGQNSTMHQTL